MSLKMKTWILIGILAVVVSSCGVSHCPLMRSNDSNQNEWASIQKKQLKQELVTSTDSHQQECTQ